MKALEKIIEAKENINMGYVEWANDCINEAIAELEALQSRSCETCAHRSLLDEALTNKVTNGFCVENGFFTKHGFCCNIHEPKEQ